MAARVYRRLQERLRSANAFDFDDLLLYAYFLLKYHPEVLAAYQQRFRYILVDEYQDTNHAQYEICRLLAESHRNIMVVGDDDQSIYSWRGADIRNILEFENDYPDCTTIKLEQNYRSVGNILSAANAVIANNMTRKPKKLMTTAEDGDKVQVFMASDERDEGRWIAGQIDKRHDEGLSYEQIERDFDGKGYGDFKTAVGEAVVAELSPIRKRYQEFLKDKKYIEECYTRSLEFVRRLSHRTVEKAMKKIGYVLPKR